MADVTDKQIEEVALETVPMSNQYIAEAEARSLQFMNPRRWLVMQKMAQTFISSNAVPESIKNASQMMMVFQAGYEAGMQPLESLNAFYIVNGRVTMFGDAVVSQIIKAGHSVEFKGDDTKATCTITRGDTKQKMSATFTIEQANKRGITTTAKGNESVFWKKFPGRMLKFKAMGEVARFIVPDAIRGVSIMENADDEVVIDANNMTFDAPKTATPPPASKPDEKKPTKADAKEADVIPPAEGNVVTPDEPINLNVSKKPHGSLNDALAASEDGETA